MPAKTKLTDAAVERLKAPSKGQIDYFDGQYPGLVLRRGKADIPDTPHQCSLMTHSGTCDQFHWTTSQLDCETRKLDTCLWNLAWYWRHKSAIRRCAFAHWFQLTKPLLRSVPTDKEASDGHQDRVAGT